MRCAAMAVLMISMGWAGTTFAQSGGVAASSAPTMEPRPAPEADMFPPPPAAPETRGGGQTEGRNQNPRVYRAAIFIKNRAGGPFRGKEAVLEDLVAARLANHRFAIISREDVINAISRFAEQPPRTGRASLNVEDKLDRALSENTSALRLAQNMNADYLLTASILTYDTDRRQFRGYGIETDVRRHNLRLSYKLLDNVYGGTLSGGVVHASDTTRLTQNLRVSKDIINNLLSRTAEKLAANLSRKAEAGRIRRGPSREGSPAAVRIVCGVQDMMVPDVVRNKKGEYVVRANKYRLEPMGVNVELDGVVIGSAPGAFQIPPGLHKLRLSRKGFEDWTRTVNITDGQMLSVAMRLTPGGREKFMEMAEFFSDLKAGQQLSNARVDVLRSIGRMIRQSGFRVDRRSKRNVTIDTDKAPRVNMNNIIRGRSFWRGIPWERKHGDARERSAHDLDQRR